MPASDRLSGRRRPWCSRAGKALDDLLAGTGAHDTLRCVVTAQGRLREGETPQLIQNDSGAVGVQLTISRPVQRAAEAVAAETMTSGCILVLDVQTAAVRASVSVPGYDPDDLAASLGASDSPFLNRALESYAVGSVFKPVLAAAALEAGLSPEYECTGAVMVDGQIFRCAGGVPHGTVNLAEALEKSCNGYFVRLGQQLSAEMLLQTAEAFGFGRQIAVAGRLYADSGNLPTAQELAQSGQLANFSFGQGSFLASPVQVAAMMNAIACGGVYRTPFFVEGTVDETQAAVSEAFSQPQGKRILSEKRSMHCAKCWSRWWQRALRRTPPGWKKAQAARPVPPRPASSRRRASSAKTCGSLVFTRPASQSIPSWFCRMGRPTRLVPALLFLHGCARRCGFWDKKRGFCLLFGVCYATIYLYFCVVFH